MRKNDHLQTPAYIYESLGPFDLDPCAGINTNIASVNLCIDRGENGLLINWEGFAFVNPPFSEKLKWIEKAKEHGNCILILPERAWAPWFGPVAEHCGKYFIMGKKINFVGGPSSNNLGSVLFPFGHTAFSRIVNSGLPGLLVTVNYFKPRR